MIFLGKNEFLLLSLILTLSNCSNESYFGKEGKIAKTLECKLPINKEHVSTEEASGNIIINGTDYLKNATIKGNLTVNGSVTIEISILKKDLVVNGSAIINHSTIEGNTTVNGTINFNDTSVKGSTTIAGITQALKSQFTDIEIYCSDTTITFNSCSLQNITFKVEDEHKDAPMTLKLIDSTVSGSIVFDNNKGSIILKGSSTIAGTVTGGTIFK